MTDETFLSTLTENAFSDMTSKQAAGDISVMFALSCKDKDQRQTQS